MGDLVKTAGVSGGLGGLPMRGLDFDGLGFVAYKIQGCAVLLEFA